MAAYWRKGVGLSEMHNGESIYILDRLLKNEG